MATELKSRQFHRFTNVENGIRSTNVTLTVLYVLQL
jgi:hypothetical protein